VKTARPERSPTLLRVSTRLPILVILGFLLNMISVAVGQAPPQEQLREYLLPNSPNSADISPNEQVVAIESTLENNSIPSRARVADDVVQLWDFKHGKLLAEFHVPDEDSKSLPKTSFNDLHAIAHGRFVRFSPMGNTLLALIGRTIYVLRAGDLATVRVISIVPLSGVESEVHGRAVIIEPRITSMEISPDGSATAVLWTRGLLYGRVQVYDSSSGKLLRSWETPQGWITFSRGLTWSPDGSALLEAIPNSIPCMRPTGVPDVFEFDVRTGKIRKKFVTGLLAGGVGISRDARMLVDDSDCIGVFANHHPKLKVFDLTSGKLVRTVAGRGSGVRYTVSVSEDGTRFLAFTGTMKAKFDWGDFVSYGVALDETFSVWNLTNYQGIVTSQNIPGLLASGLRLSPNGRYAVSYGKASFVYELP